MENIAKQPLEKPSEGLGSTNTTTLSQPIEQIMISILNKLPIKSLIRFKLVSKSWHDMIANPHRPDSCYSLKTRLGPPSLSTRSHLLGFFTGNQGKINYIPYHDMDDGASDACYRFVESREYPLMQMCAVASSKGIILLACTRYRPANWVYTLYYVCNPLTRQTVRLPVLKERLTGYESIRFHCQVEAVSTSTSSCNVASGGGVVSDVIMHYVVMVVSNSRNMCVFSSREESPSWRILPRREITDATGEPILVEGTKTHVMPGVINASGLWKDISIVTCDLSKEGFRSYSGLYTRIKPPLEDLINHQDSPTYTLLGTKRSFQNVVPGSPPRKEDSIYYGVYFYELEEIQVWVYKNRTNSDGGGHCWKLKHRVTLQELRNMYPKELEPIENYYYQGSLPFQLRSFHPCLPGIVFFTYQDRFFSYRFKDKLLELHCSRVDYYAFFGSFIPLEWSPWPYRLSQAK